MKKDAITFSFAHFKTHVPIKIWEENKRLITFVALLIGVPGIAKLIWQMVKPPVKKGSETEIPNSDRHTESGSWADSEPKDGKTAVRDWVKGNGSGGIKLIPNLPFPDNGVSIIFAGTGVGKTPLLLYCAYAVATGVPSGITHMYDSNAPKRRVKFFNPELSNRQLESRLGAVLIPPNMTITEQVSFPNLSKLAVSVRDFVFKEQSDAVCFIDSISMIVTKRDIEEDVKTFIRTLHEISNEATKQNFNVSFILSGALVDNPTGDAHKDIAGSKFWTIGMDCIYVMYRRSEEDRNDPNRILVQEKNRNVRCENMELEFVEQPMWHFELKGLNDEPPKYPHIGKKLDDYTDQDIASLREHYHEVKNRDSQDNGVPTLFKECGGDSILGKGLSTFKSRLKDWGITSTDTTTNNNK